MHIWILSLELSRKIKDQQTSSMLGRFNKNWTIKTTVCVKSISYLSTSDLGSSSSVSLAPSFVIS